MKELFYFRNSRPICISYKAYAMMLLIILAQCFICANAESSGELNYFRGLWKSKKYVDVYKGLKEYRKKEPYAKNAEVYYLIGTSLCRIPGVTHLGKEYLQWLVDHFSISDEQHKIIEKEMSGCTRLLSDLPVNIVFNDTKSTAGVSGRSKMFYFPQRETPFTSSQVEVIKNLSRELIISRLFNKGNDKAAIEFVKKHLDGNPVVINSKNFILANNSGISREYMANQLLILEDVYEFFIRFYGMREPKQFITIYWLRDSASLMKYAMDNHGIKLARNSAGYSYRDDLSMVASYQSGSGTLLHELFHLMVRNNFGDIPPWLDEGLAALYEVSLVQDGEVTGLPNWRQNIMDKLRRVRPSINQMVNMNWSEFNAKRYSGAQQAINYATARYFCLFLQENNLLNGIYSEISALEVGDDNNVNRILKNKFPQGLDKLDKQFEEWVYGL